MPSTLPLPNDLPGWLSRKFRELERRLRVLERPDGTQKAMLLQQVEDANKTIAAQQATIAAQQATITQQRGWLDDHQRQLTAQAKRISTLESGSSSSASTISSLQSRLSAAEARIDTTDSVVKALANQIAVLEAAKGRYASLKARLDAIDKTGL